MTKTKLTKNEKKLLFDFLYELLDSFGDAGCNDTYLPKTKENYNLIETIIKSTRSKVDAKEELEGLNDDWKSKGIKDLFIFDTDLLEYLIKKLKKVL